MNDDRMGHQHKDGREGKGDSKGTTKLHAFDIFFAAKGHPVYVAFSLALAGSRRVSGAKVLALPASCKGSPTKFYNDVSG
jgi:hypothetical protein